MTLDRCSPVREGQVIWKGVSRTLLDTCFLLLLAVSLFDMGKNKNSRTQEEKTTKTR